VLQAIELVGGGEGGAIVAGAVEEASHLVERILSSLDGDSARVSPPAPPRRAPRSEGAAALVIEDREHALARSARPLAAVVASLAWTASDLPALAALSAPAAVTSALVVSPHAGEALDRLLAGSAWAGIERRHVPPSAGDHEGLGATALVAAAGLVHAGTAREVLVVGLTRGRGYAFLLAVPEGPAGR
jgi:hypothetical protein